MVHAALRGENTEATLRMVQQRYYLSPEQGETEGLEEGTFQSDCETLHQELQEEVRGDQEPEENRVDFSDSLHPAMNGSS